MSKLGKKFNNDIDSTDFKYISIVSDSLGSKSAEFADIEPVVLEAPLMELQKFFDPRYFFITWLTLVAVDVLSSDFEFCHISMKLFIIKILKINSLLLIIVRSQKLSLRKPIPFTPQNFLGEQCSTSMVDFMIQGPF
jgi:hypothetical protein